MRDRFRSSFVGARVDSERPPFYGELNRKKGVVGGHAAQTKRIVILGGGFGGLYPALYLDRTVARDPGIEGLISLTNSTQVPLPKASKKILIGNYMSEAVYPSILHQDPRYFRRGTGSGCSRFAYAVSQIFWTHRDSGGTQFNYSEWVGNSTAVAISNAYYRDQRTAGSSISKLAMQIGVDAVGNVLKEFWPDLQRKFSKRSRNYAKTMEKSAQ